LNCLAAVVQAHGEHALLAEVLHVEDDLLEGVRDIRLGLDRAHDGETRVVV